MSALLLLLLPAALAADPLTVNPGDGATVSIGPDGTQIVLKAGFHPKGWRIEARADGSLDSAGANASVFSGGAVGGAVGAKVYVGWEGHDSFDTRLMNYAAAFARVVPLSAQPALETLFGTSAGPANLDEVAQGVADVYEKTNGDATKDSRCTGAPIVLLSEAQLAEVNTTEGKATLVHSPDLVATQCSALALALTAYPAYARSAPRPDFRQVSTLLNDTVRGRMTFGLQGEVAASPSSTVDPSDVTGDATSQLDWDFASLLAVQQTNARWEWRLQAGITGDHGVSSTTTEVCKTTETGSDTATAQACEDVEVLDADPTTSFGWAAEARLNVVAFTGKYDVATDTAPGAAPGLEVRFAASGAFADPGVTLKPGLFAYLLKTDTRVKARTGVGVDVPFVTGEAFGGPEIYAAVGLDL